MKKSYIVALASLIALAGGACSASTETRSETRAPEISIEQPWVRTTDGATSTSATGMFMSIVNPGKDDVKLTEAAYDGAGKTEIHEMVKGADGKMVMQAIKDGLTIKAGAHEHLKPGGNHVMLMMLKKPLPVGEEVTVTLKFSTGQSIDVKAPVKKFTEETEHYHPSASATPSK